jgi:hypothetical protein
MRRSTLLGTVLVALLLPAGAQADYKRCSPVIDIFDGTRYAGSDLYRIRARGHMPDGPPSGLKGHLPRRGERAGPERAGRPRIPQVARRRRLEG